MRCITLASGSKGNCTYIEGESGAILIDAGLSVKELFRRMTIAGANPDLVDAIIVTHEHTDHLRGVVPLAGKLGVPVFATDGTLYSQLTRMVPEKKPVRFVTCRYREPFFVEEFTIEAFPVSHDAREPCGFYITVSDTRFGFCTDTGIITEGMMDYLRRSDAVVLESNHCPEMLRTGPYPEVLKRRIRSKHGHLSNVDASECIMSLGEDVSQIRLAHLSEVNNTPATALKSGKKGLGLFIDSISLTVASETGPGNCWSEIISL
jgi:phosphoribosyl 1,2-cyclic phosphodiesterase